MISPNITFNTKAFLCLKCSTDTAISETAVSQKSKKSLSKNLITKRLVTFNIFMVKAK